MKSLLFSVAPLLMLAACSGGEDSAPESDAVQSDNASLPSEPAPSATAMSASPILTLEGLGELKIGQPVPDASQWAARGVQAGDGCTVYSSPDFPGVYAIVTEGLVRRITLGRDSTVKLAEGIGAGATEAEVRGFFAGFREEPHKYVEAPAKYLTAPNAESGDSALRFEIDADGVVSDVHIGTMPELGFVEGCA